MALHLRSPCRITTIKNSFPRLIPLQLSQSMHLPASGPRRTLTSATWDGPPPSPLNDDPRRRRALERLPTAALLRGIVMQAAMSQPYVMGAASALAQRNIQILTSNFPLRFLLDKIFYAQFCAGSTEAEIKNTVRDLKALGFKGVITAYAREVDLSNTAEADSEAKHQTSHQGHVTQWLEGSLKGVHYSSPGDFVALKFTGAGPECVRLLEAGLAPDAAMAEALTQICDSAKSRGVRLLIDAEHHSQQAGIDSWTMYLMEKYNQNGNLVVYNTYQMYLKESTATLTRHLERARSGKFAFGVKLVRGAYLKSDPRHLIHDSREETDRAYDDAARMLATQHLGDPSAPKIGVMLATHNSQSVEMMRSLRQEQMQKQLPLAEVVYAQLMGMADELSLGLLQKRQNVIEEDIQVFKYAVWGTTEECMMYLLRRADENRDAVDRGQLTQQALWRELRLRLFPWISV
ncbi:proline oxidase [Blastomyces dermatitidis ER-3]|uniref:Proline dehydrogenase n=2 Tax=Ajellomyces dermatitidis TaxID=5039 RepID=F2TMD5_AJEDA|nr:proline oxidase [Blastomyces dermatitidis ER-3]EEQ89556.1 proline oxidase [Blastomyces dermatitidis ER-3]EGE84398.1 proline oxidase [Blastomyces dermatitidis ATCC 18188]